jgi:hypothetical protein
VVVHASSTTLSTATLASFLIGQSNYTYLGTSTDWTDPFWTWHPEYDVTYGSPLGPPVRNSSGWFREFTGCSVWVAGPNQARITMKK